MTKKANHRVADEENEATFMYLHRAADRARYAANTVAEAAKSYVHFKDEDAVQKLADTIAYLADAQKNAAEALQSIAPKRGGR